MINESKYRIDIQVLRGLAVLAVVFFHADESYFPLGYLGVDVFFVISGFVVTPLILRMFTDQARKEGRLSNLSNFYKRRFYRLAPALAIVLMISAVLIFLLGPIADHQRFARQGIATLLLAGNFGADRYSGDYFSPNPNPIVHTWSLSVEEQIYIFLPVVMMLLLQNTKNIKKVSVFLLGAISAVSFVSFLFPMILQPFYFRADINLPSQFSFYSPIDRIWQFTGGGLVFVLTDQHGSSKIRIAKGIQLLTLIAIFIILFGQLQTNVKVGSVLASLIAASVILFRSLEVLPDYLVKKLEWVGDRSYSIYLIHMPLMYLAKYSPVTQIGTNENRLSQTVIAVISSILLGALSFSKIENRFRDKGNLSDRQSFPATIFLTLMLPLCLFMSIDIGYKAKYWGLDRNTEQPPYAGTLDPKCARDGAIELPCVYVHAFATRTVLLVGDSHAGHISQAVVDAAQVVGWNVVIWAHSGCQIQFTKIQLKRIIPDQALDNCINKNKKMKKWVWENKPDVIIVSQFVRADSSQNDLREALSTLQLAVPNILLIENNPVFPDEKDFVWVNRPIIMPEHKPPKSFPQSMMQMKDKNASYSLAKWARSHGIFTISFDGIFCKKGICSRYSDKGWLYRDAHHFSVIGAELTIPQLVTFLKQF